MSNATETAFQTIPRDPHGHFSITLYAALFRLLYHIHKHSGYGGESLEKIIKRYPFVGAYFEEMRGFLPESMGWEQGAAWWRAQIVAWESEAEAHLPLRALTKDMGLTFDARLAFLLIGLIEEDSRFGTLFAELQRPLDARRPALELIGQILKDDSVQIGATDAWTLCRPLFNVGLIESLNPQAAPRSEWTLRVPGMLWDAARGQIEPQPTAGVRYHPANQFPEIAELLFPTDIVQRLHRIPAMLASGDIEIVVIRGDPGAELLDVMGALARCLNLGLLSIIQKSSSPNVQWPSMGTWCAMSRCVPTFSYDLGPGETAELPTLAGYRGPLGVILGQEGGLSHRSLEKSITLNLPPPDIELRLRHWRRAFNGRSCEDLEIIAESFHLSGGYIRQVGQMAFTQAGLDGRDRVHLHDIREASRTLNRQRLDALASRLEASGSWSELIVSEATMSKLSELTQRCRHRERLLENLGAAFNGSANCGVRALFTGVSGTGKTLGAKILASELGMDVYRVDLAAIINKYIGETEKNLHQVLTHAEALDVILLLDEGDSLLGNRTEVKSSNDRYANLETNFLLQRLENYQGIVVVTTNLGENIDQAFKRRMDVVVPFFSPQANERMRILDLHLPANHAVDINFLQQVAQRCILTGGQIRNATLHAALLALDAETPVLKHHLEEALKSEYRKAGGTFPLVSGNAGAIEQDSGMDTFISALQATQY